ncbi:hypothetical protein IFM89_012581 [Coptis chinensis]|uniref:RNase H type-1 domain-containing protein n=1 Tax=Coptis chinensis TaxID=261450 RepID=A0A835H5N1_9MAGN|nr:hypothetical protein IFM89_012581 [Coptis chinensis]
MQLDDETVKNSNAAVLIVTSASVKYKDENAEYVLSSTAATMLYLNLQIPRVADIINSPIPAPRTLLLPEPPQAPPGITAQRKTLSDIIASVNDASSKQMLFTCEATISQILHDKGWSYNACPHPKCLKAVDITSNGYTCMNHGIVSPEQRYQLRMEIKDGVSTAKVVAFRPEATTLLQKTEEELAHIESRWELLELDHTIKTNYDGAEKCNPGNADLGVVYRNSSGDFMLVLKLGIKTNYLVECLAILEGIECAIQRGWVESDLEAGVAAFGI